jgi:hypothetical protein
MKKSDVPQDDSILGEHRRACYALDEQGRYVIVASRGWEVEKVMNAQAVDEIRAQVEMVREQALRGEVSPLAYHMARCQMTPGLLAANAGVWHWRVKRHLAPRHFARLDRGMLQRYADALGMAVEALTQVPERKQA